MEEVQRAVDYMTHKRAKKIGEVKQLPEVYKRLWGGVEKKFRKARELSTAIEGQRRLEWLKLLLSSNHLHLTDKKQLDLLKQLATYEDRLLSVQTTGLLNVTNLKQPHQRGASQQQPNNAEMSRLLELFDEEQEAQFQRAMLKWQELERLKAAEVMSNKGGVQSHEANQTLENQSVLSPKNEGAPPSGDFVSLYITEQPPNFAL